MFPRVGLEIIVKELLHTVPPLDDKERTIQATKKKSVFVFSTTTSVDARGVTRSWSQEGAYYITISLHL